jgi:nicotinamidase-related amidase
MPARSSDLHGNAPDTCPVALVLIDVINDLEFPGGRELLRTALPAASRIARLAHRAREAAIPVIYANDNFGRWRSDFREVVEHCLRDDVRGRPIVELLAPKREDYFVLKPKHSAFYSTTLATLLAYLEVKRLVLTGFAGEACVLVSAADAYMHDFQIFVPSDCTASRAPANNRQALAYMARVLHADTRSSARLDLRKLMNGSGPRSAKGKSRRS